ncbi:MAG: hypothetical protein V7K67_28700 [Nostoc sp.]
MCTSQLNHPQLSFHRGSVDVIADRGTYVHYDVAEFQEDLKTLQESG